MSRLSYRSAFQPSTMQIRQNLDATKTLVLAEIDDRFVHCFEPSLVFESTAASRLENETRNRRDAPCRTIEEQIPMASRS